MKFAGNKILLAAAIIVIASFVFLCPAFSRPTLIKADNVASGPDNSASGPSDTASGPGNTASGPGSGNDYDTGNTNNDDSNATTTSACYDPCKKDPYYYWENAEKHWVTSCPVCNLNTGINKDLENTGDNSQVAEGLVEYLNPNGTTQYDSTDPQFPNWDSSVVIGNGTATTSSAPDNGSVPAPVLSGNGMEANSGANPASDSITTNSSSQNQISVPCAGKKCNKHKSRKKDDSVSDQILSTAENNPQTNGPDNRSEAGMAATGDNSDGLPFLSNTVAPFTVKTGETNIDLQLDVANADKVYFYIGGGSVPLSAYIGTATFNGSSWVYRVNLDNNPLPNGNYSVWAQVIINGVAYRVKESAVDVEMEIPADSERIAQMLQKLRDNDTKTTETNKLVENAIVETIDKVVGIAGIDPVVTENYLREFAQLAQDRELLNSQSVIKSAQLKKITARIAEIEDEIGKLPEDAIALIKSDKLMEINDLQSQLDSVKTENDDIERISQSNRQRAARLNNSLASMAADEIKTTELNNILSDFKTKISLLEQASLEENSVLTQDTDGDSLNDRQELTIGTDPTNPDTDGDGILDGDEYANGYDPLQTNSFPDIEYHSPQTAPPRNTGIYRFDDKNPVAEAALANGDSGIRFKGYGLPKAYVTLFMYSDPLIVVVKTDELGQWTYTLDKPTEDGEHTVYAAQTNSIGQIQSRSEVMIFVKNGNNVEKVVSSQEASLAATTKKMQKGFAWTITIFTIPTIAVALLLIGYIYRREIKKIMEKDQSGENPNQRSIF